MGHNLARQLRMLAFVLAAALVVTMLHLPRAVTTTTLYAQHLGYDLTLDSAGGGETAVLDKGEVHYAYVNAARAAGLFTKSDYSKYTT